MKPVVLLVLAFYTVNAVSLNTYWDENDTKRLSKVLENVLQTKTDNIASLHFAASGLKLLNVQPSAAIAKAACDVAKKADLTKLETLYHASALAGDLSGCSLNVGAAQKTIEDVLKASKPNGEMIAMALRSADRLAIKVDKAAFDALLTKVMKDDSPSSLAWVLNAAVFLDKAQSAKYFDKIKVLVSQADEIDKRFLKFEEGLTTTSNAIHGILSLSEKQGKAPAVTKDQLLLFTNYLLSRKHVSTEKSAFHLLSALGVLVNNHQAVPVTASLQGPVMINRNKPVIVTICNVFGLPITLSAVKADILSGTGAKQVENLQLTAVQGSSISYSLASDKFPAAPGFYKIALKLQTQDKRLIGLTDSSVVVKLTNEVVVDDLKVGALEKDDVISGASLSSVAQFSKLGNVITADHTKRLYISFSVKAKGSDTLVKPHQAFVLFKHADGAEVFYTADVQSNGKYLVDINLAKAYKDFEGVSGKYTAYLILGDANIRTPFNWAFADFTLNLPAAAPEVVPKSQRIDYDVKPEIVHQFRQPEKRPPVIVSDAFTLICLAPLVLLLGLWLRIGLNFGNMPLSLWTVFFHCGLAALFVLYLVFWIQLNMFETLKYLAIIGGFTYLAGNRVLKAIAEKRKRKTE